MYEIQASIAIDAPAERVFAAVSNHEGFLRGPNMSCRLVKEGRESRNGLGAVREVTWDGSVFTEEVIAFEPPRHYTYVVRKLVNSRGKPVPMVHERGWLEITSLGEATRVDWRSRFAITLPVVGWFLERFVGPRAARGFREILQQAKADLEQPLPAGVKVPEV